MYKTSIAFFACLFLYVGMVCAQTDSIVNKLSSASNIDSKAIAGLQKQDAALQSKLDKQSAKLLLGMQHSEDKLQRRLSSIDTLKAQALFTNDIKQHYIDLQSSLSQTTGNLKKFPLKEYIPGIDSLQTGLNFLLRNPNLPTDKLEQLQALTTTLKNLQTELQKSNDIQEFVRKREAVLKEQLLNSGFTKQLTGINKKVFYYQQQLQDYKSLLNDKEKLKEKMLETVRSLPAFREFWQKNSYLAALFPLPSNYGTPQAIAGLQTRASVQTVINQRMGLPPNPNSASSNMGSGNPFQQQLGAAEAQLDQLKNKLNKISNSSGSSDMTMPDFKPNDEKTKSFLKRLEYGFNIQSEPGRYSLPAMSDIALTLGYKLCDNKTFGIGASYKIGWGTIQHMQISSQGLGLRSYVDIKSPIDSKGAFLQNLWISGGFEWNYLSSFRSIQELHDNVDVWQRSALMGITKKYKVGKKEGNMQFLYDFLHNWQTPPSTAFKFRLGYTF
jgi:hypothetical protein